jgi:hypothetical protein
MAGKPRFKHYPRSVIQSRKDHPSTLFMTIQAPVVKQWQLKSGDIVEQIFVIEGSDTLMKVRKVSL